MTMRDLAKLANVSVSTVSKAFREADDVSPQTREQIFALAREQGCFGKYYKGRYHKKVVAIICPELLSDYYSRFTEGLREQIEKSGCMCLMSSDNFSKEKQEELIDYYVSHLQVDGLFVLNMKASLKKAYDKPVVSLFSDPGGNVDSVSVDTAGAVRSALQLLIRLGHRHIAFLGEPLTCRKAEEFQQSVREWDIPDAVVLESPHRFEKAGEDGVRRLLSGYPKTTAILCAYDNIAYGAIRALQETGLEVPRDMSVVGIDNNSTSGYMKPELTAVDMNPREVCQIAWELLNRKLENKGFRARQTVTIKPELILRESHGAPRE